MIAIFALADVAVTREQVSNWLKREGDADAQNCSDTMLAVFLNGLINEKRGKREGEQPKPEKRLTNNIILTKLKIAFNLKAEDIIELIAATGMKISKPELSALFRKPDHKHFRQCKDQFLRNFLQGLEGRFFVHRKAKPSAVNVENTDETVKESNPLKDNHYKQAKPQASKIYMNPNKKTEKKAPSDRKVLKLKPSDIWKN